MTSRNVMGWVLVVVGCLALSFMVGWAGFLPAAAIGAGTTLAWEEQ